MKSKGNIAENNSHVLGLFGVLPSFSFTTSEQSAIVTDKDRICKLSHELRKISKVARTVN